MENKRKKRFFEATVKATENYKYQNIAGSI
jgi:hypothetical protein